MKLTSLVAAAAIATAATPAMSAETAAPADPGPKYNIMGPSTCDRWPTTGAITSASKAVPLNWALGFLSGWAADTNLKLLEVIDPEAVSSWLDSHCKEHPTDTLPIAVRELEGELEAKLPKPPEPPLFGPPIAVPEAPKAEPPAKAAPKPKPVRRKRAAPARRS